MSFNPAVASTLLLRGCVGCNAGVVLGGVGGAGGDTRPLVSLLPFKSVT